MEGPKCSKNSSYIDMKRYWKDHDIQSWYKLKSHDIFYKNIIALI